MSRLKGRFGACAAVLVTIALGGCARPVGDFGRAEDDPLHDAMSTMTAAVHALGQPLSAFNLSNEETDMRNRVWRYLVAPEAYDWFGDSVVELSREGFQIKDLKPPPKDRYYLWLHGQAFASSSARYARLSDDVNADLAGMPATFTSICAVETLDGQRRTAEDGITDLEPGMKVGVTTRRAENATMIRWFATAVAARYDAFSYGLDHLLVETPDINAIAADTSLNQLAVFVDKASRSDFCEGAALPGGRQGPSVRSRYTVAPLVTGTGS